MATDLAEFLGAALGFYLLLGIPLWIAGFITAIITFVILGLERYGFRPLEAIITAMIGIISISYLVETILVKPVWGQVLYHAVVPQFAGPDSIFLAAGILGATVMPHVIFLHSSLTQNRIVVRTPAKLRRLFKFELTDVVIAMGVAGLINAAMLMMAASTFFRTGLTSVGTIQEAHQTLQPLLGKASSIFFALALLASGLSSSSVGTMAGQVIMQGFLQWHVPVWIRRIATMLPALTVILIGLDPTRTLVISQVLLSFGLPFAIIPLVMFTSRRKVMKTLVNHKITTLVASLVAALIVVLNIYLLVQIISGK
jgi:manganese transport protein